MSESKPKAGTPRLKLIEKRSIVYARLPSSLKINPSIQPSRIEYIPYATLAWIEHLLKKDKTDWPWFATVLRFLKSPSYAEIERYLIAEIESNKQAQREFYESFKVRVVPAKTPKPAALAQAEASWPSARPRGDRPYFWENIDTLAWREQE
jgi:hypothetical protein